jgi:FKBP-type peptidyl-prolyl cis-trans isomerase
MKLTKKIFVAPLVAGALITGGFAATTSNDNASYSVGYSMGKNFQSQTEQAHIKADNAQIIDGLKAGVSGDKSKLSDKKMQAAMEGFQKQMIASQKK